MTPKSCYCREEETSCGKCMVCGQAGHSRHYPGPVPCTLGFCDFHYERLGFTQRAIERFRIENPEATHLSCQCPVSPNPSESLTLPPDSCGFCEVCGEGGHLHSFPTELYPDSEKAWWSYPRAWCDTHYRELLEWPERRRRRIKRNRIILFSTLAGLALTVLFKIFG